MSLRKGPGVAAQVSWCAVVLCEHLMHDNAAGLLLRRMLLGQPHRCASHIVLDAGCSGCQPRIAHCA
jgi:hypothetical protein